MKKRMNRGLALALSLTLAFGVPYTSKSIKSVKAEAIGSLASEVTGTWSYWDGKKEVVQSNEMLMEKLPTIQNKNFTRWTTDNYDNNNKAFDTSGWSTSMMWTYLNPSEDGTPDAFGNSIYAIPLSYKATSSGMMVTKPSTINVAERTMLMNQPHDGSLTDFILGGGSYTSSNVDKVTEWSTDVMMENEQVPTEKMKLTMTQGSPFTFVQMNGTTQAKIYRYRQLPSAIIAYNGTSVSNSTMLVLRVFDNQDDAAGYSNYDYYAVYVPEGTTWEQQASSYADNHIGEALVATFSSEQKAYYTFAWLCESKGVNDAQAKAIAETYQSYAFNFVTDTSTAYTYDKTTSTLTTTFHYTLDKKEESTANGTIMGLIPHQYKNMSGYTYLNHEARTIRGQLKYLVGDTYQTKLRYSGILPAMPEIYDSDMSEMKSYIKDFMEKYGPTDTKVTKENYGENTYDCGKKMNRAIQVMEAAEVCGDTENAEKLLAGIEAELVDWFTYSGEEDEKYFYYDEELGTLFGFPQSYYTVDGITDHHFHYGYFIQAAAQVALRDPSFVDKYGNVVDELIGDIATPTKNSATARYPFLRAFSTWEGHSWASGHANFADGNNQESSSESINASAALILYGQATHNEELTNLGIYQYQTEVSAVNNYWFDIDGDVLDPKFKQNNNTIIASMVWGGKYDYAAWWTAEPLQIQGINILPMTAASFYYAANKEFIIRNWELAVANENAYSGEDKNPNRWNEIWSAYLAIADPEKALEYMNLDCESEAGDSKAHLFHYTNSLDKVGTPDLSITSDNPLSSAFRNQDGEVTYVVYNADPEMKTVTFSDGTEIVAEPGKITTVFEGEGEQLGKASYTIERYIQNANGEYNLFQTDYKLGKIGSEVTVSEKEYSGYAVNDKAEGSLLSGIVLDDNSLVLKVYYDIVEEKPYSPMEDDKKYQKLGTTDGLDLYYYILKDDFGVSIRLLDAGITFYVEYNGQLNADNTTAWLNKQETPENVYTGVCKFNPKSLPKNAYSTLKLKSGTKNVYVIIKYGTPTEEPDISDYEGKIETANPNLPVDLTGFALGSTADNTVNIAFKAPTERNQIGQKYNVYVDGEKRLEGVPEGNYTIENVSGGKITLKITATLNGRETQGITQTIKVGGEIYDKPVVLEKTTAEVVTKTEETTMRREEVTTKKVTVGRAIIRKAKRIKKTKIRLTLKTMKGAKGYVVKYSTSKKFKKKATKIKYFTKTKFNIRRLKPNKKYYIKVRAYKLVNGKKKFGKWSKKKVVKVKK